MSTTSCTRSTVVCLVLCSAFTVGCQSTPNVAPPEIPFADYVGGDATEAEFDRLEREHPLTPSDLLKVTPENLEALSQEHVDQIFARITAGPIPDGTFDGTAFFPGDNSGARRVAEIERDAASRSTGLTVKKIEAIARFLWKGKVFYREQGILRNRVEDTALLAPLIEGRTSDIPRIEVDQEDTWLLFPAKVFCGPSPIDRRRESIHIDYADTDEIEGYREIPDALAGRNGFKVLDEIRMVRPGFYLGRAYMGDTFLLNFTLYREDIAARETDEFVRTGRISEDCLSGEQQPAATTVN